MNVHISVSAVEAINYKFVRMRTVSLSVGAAEGDDNAWYLGKTNK